MNGPVESPNPSAAASAPTNGQLVLTIPSELMGRGEHPELGEILIRSFLHALTEAQSIPDSILFFNSGVKLVTAGSAALPDLQTLAGRGVRMLICGTCLGYYELKEKVAVGEISNMYVISETMMKAARVVSL
jgi:selenium metabolism protein YedF